MSWPLLFRRSVVLLPFLVACSQPATTALRAELELYLRHLNDWAPAEAETARTIDRILATQFVDEAEVRRQIAADAPRVQKVLERIRGFTPTSPEIREVHRVYVDGWSTLAAGYEAILAGFDQGDPSRLSAGRRDLEAWRGAVVDTADRVARLMEQTGLSTKRTA